MNAPSPGLFASKWLGVLTLLFALVLLHCPALAHADIKLSVDAENGAKISDVYTLVSHAQSQTDIAKVEFRVDNKLRFTATSVPYQFEWDTIADMEGAHDVLITAFDAGGRSKSLTLSLTIDNELGLGADALAHKASDALAAKDLDTATRYAHRAIKADPNNLSALRAQAGIFAAQQDWEQAIATLSKAHIPDDDAEDLDLLATYRMRRALLPENVNRFTTELQPIVDLRRKIKAILIARTKAQNPPQADGQISAAGHAAIGDAYFAAGDMKTALLEYRACGTDDSTPTPDRNRLALGNLSNAQYTEAGRILRSLMLTKKDDSATRAIDGLLMLRELKFADARAAVQNDVTAHVPAALLIAAFADMALGKHTEAASEAREATHLLPNAADAQYALAVVSPDINESDRALAHALTLAPFQSGPYLRFAERVALTKDASRERIEEALSIAAYILKYDPDNVAALLLQAMLYCQTDRAALAEPILAALLKRDNTSLDILMGGAVYGRVADQPEKRGAFMDTIRKYFPDRSDEMDLIISPAGMLYTLDVKYAYRPYAFLCPTTLYPAK